MASEIDIANLALQHLGESIITDLNDTSDKASRTCNANFTQARDEALQTAPWSFAKKQEELDLETDAPIYKWSSAYALPDDFLRLCEIDGQNAWMPAEYFDQQGNLLLMGRGNYDEPAETVIIEYIFKQEDTTLYSPLFVECMAMLMAMKMARTLTGSDTKAQALREEYERVVLPRARTLNASQIYTGKNHPIRSMLTRSFMNRARRSGNSSHVGIEDW